MKRVLNVIGIHSTPAFRLDPALTGEERIVLRALASGKTDKQVCKDLRMDPTIFLRMMRDIREKIGTTDNISLIAWATQQIKDGDQRLDGRERYGLPVCA
jgi:DNA-binding NarL/FixJ family response regulator